MSEKAVKLVDESGLMRTQRRVALAYADYADDETDCVDSSIRRICWETGYSRKTVQRQTKKLVKLGVLARIGVTPEGKRVYRMNFAMLPDRMPLDEFYGWYGEWEAERRGGINLKEIHELDNHSCVYCGEPSEHVDHVIPRSRGGSDEIGNLVAACAVCNLTKSNHLLSELGWTFLEGTRPYRWEKGE